MKTYKKILFVSIFIFLGFWSSKVYSEDLLGDFSESINSIQEGLDSLPKSELKEAVIIDEAIIEINKSIEFIEQSMSNDDIESAIATLDFIDKSLSDISSLVPEEIYSDMSDIDMKSFNHEDLVEIQKITNTMNVNKKKIFKEMVSTMMKLNEKGFNAFTVANKLNDLGVDAMDIRVQMESAEIMKTWTKKDWANSWQGEVANTLTLNSGEKVKLTAEEVEDLKAEMAIANASKLGFADIAEETLSSMNEVSQNIDTIEISATIENEGIIRYIKNGVIMFVPTDEGNRHYREIMQQVKEGSLDLKVNLNSMSSTIQNTIPQQIQEVVKQEDGAIFINASTIKYTKGEVTWFVPTDEGNRHYREIVDLVNKGELNITATKDAFITDSQAKSLSQAIDKDTLKSLTEKTGSDLINSVKETKEEVQKVTQEAAKIAKEAAKEAASKMTLEERIVDTGGMIQFTSESGDVWHIPKAPGNRHYENYITCGNPEGCGGP